MTHHRPSRPHLPREAAPEVVRGLDQAPATLELHAHIHQAAFEAAYMELPNPDPASSCFVALVTAHEARLWAEHHGDPSPASQLPTLAARDLDDPDR